ncbi:DUF6489 family protein [Methylobacterium isbiliense]|jgi:hypothetical protein|uniref:Phasin domain-containing protein n=1 Tax=Methylobacterium isbiliense TaxID=315478 RepID=A0ABQ4SDP8_9HYPH|nr:DUF6489 family protein [Methylobacterium isbiliense]MDN3625603.1 DUF6489 family protein [Methylobacterium isbiliense]GJE00038.1 hypothetical protein GMJLKIPL_1956 [Methylobacterium isbiliense]
MKFRVEVDCTPLEARQFVGLPNLEPMQAAVMAELERRMLADIERFSPDAMLRSWFSLFPQNAEQMQSMFLNMFQQGFGGTAAPARTDRERE